MVFLHKLGRRDDEMIPTLKGRIVSSECVY